jgi:hypothetical protein
MNGRDEDISGMDESPHRRRNIDPSVCLGLMRVVLRTTRGMDAGESGWGEG